jgi:hypothetical protein
MSPLTQSGIDWVVQDHIDRFNAERDREVRRKLKETPMITYRLENEIPNQECCIKLRRDTGGGVMVCASSDGGKSWDCILKLTLKGQVYRALGIAHLPFETVGGRIALSPSDPLYPHQSLLA